ncbi:MAG: type II toxin-antitoxin system RelE/ParE family toxin [Chloroflexota bacterium]|nr:type II toxin-antitoxin system RelE/ParE family toxin [Chloroflexota bacterium]
MTRLLVSPRARRNLRRLIETHSLPTTTTDRFRASIQPLASIPLLGQALSGRWSGYRYLLGPWRWMIIVYEYHEDQELVAIVTVQDARSEQAPTASR